MKKRNLIFFALFFVLLGIIFKNWLISANIIGGDWPFFFQEYINHFSFLPPVWNSVEANGLGGQSIIYSTDSYLYFTGWLFSVILHIPWPVVYKIVWFGFFIIFSSYSGIYLFGIIFPKSPFWQRLLAAMVYTTNTYILLVVGGGQMGVALSYAMSPLVLARFILLHNNFYYLAKRLLVWDVLLAGLLLALQVLFDVRYAYIIMCGVVLYIILFTRYSVRQFFPILLYILVIPVGISVLLHAYWLLPVLAFRQNPLATLGSVYTSVASVRYFSFATFSNAIGLLHPYWPENIFGKVSFMQPEYLVIPIIAYFSLFFVTNNKIVTTNKKVSNSIELVAHEDKLILFFVLLGLLGAFLSKGANDPFGGIYILLFNHIPGFGLFRDPTKWYTLIAVSYAILLPFTVGAMYAWIRESKKITIFGNQISLHTKGTLFSSQNFIIIVFFIFWLFTIRQAVLGQLTVTFASHTVPLEYVQLKNTLIEDPIFSRTLWIPKLQRYGYYDQIHPAVEGAGLFNTTTSEQLVKILHKKGTEQKLQELSIKYLIVPFDSEHEFFLKGSNYNPAEPAEIISQLNTIPWLKRDGTFKELAIYTMTGSKDKFWMQGTRNIKYQLISDGYYTVAVSPGPAARLIFNETYNPYWSAEKNGSNITDDKFGEVNSFSIPTSTITTLMHLRYLPVIYFQIGRIISLLTLLVVICLLFIVNKSRNYMKVAKTNKIN